MGWQSCTDKRQLYLVRFWTRWQKEYDFDLDTPFQDYPQEIHDVLIRGTEWPRGEGAL